MRAVFNMNALGLAFLISAQAAAFAGEQEAWTADKAFLSALASSDGKIVRHALREDFTGIGRDGHLFNRTKAVAEIATLAANAKSEGDVQRHFYGRLATVRGSHNGLRFLRIWAEHNGEWRLYAMIDTPVVPRERASIESQAGTGVCENPCQTVPYRPRTAMDKAILSTWQETKRIELKPNAAAWARHIGDEFMIINNTTIRTRPERVVIAQKQEAAGVGTPGDPILSMSIRDFGKNAAVMLSKHFPVRGGKPYNNVRVWVLRDDRWQLAISQQSEIASGEPLPAVVGNDAIVMKADQALLSALAKNDADAAREPLDRYFSWTDSQGRTYTRGDVLRARPPMLDLTGAATKMRLYGQVAVLTSNRDNAYALRIWIKRGKAWHALVYHEVAVTPPPANAPAGPRDTNCENPCKTLPFRPRTADERAAMASWQALETAVTAGNGEEWARHAADEFVVVGNARVQTKEQRRAVVSKAGSAPAPLAWAKLYDFPEAIVMVCEHQPHSGKPTRVSRVWIKRDGTWQMAVSYQTTIQGAQPKSAVR